MRAEYEEEVDLLVIELQRNDRPTKGDWTEGKALIEFVGDHAVSIEFVSASENLPDRIAFAADRADRNASALQAIADLAIANPDTLVTLYLEVHPDAHL